MSSLFNTTQPQPGATNSNLFGMNTNTMSTGLNNQQQLQNQQFNNVQQFPVIDSRYTIRQLTTLIPEWKGHFDVADAVMTSQEQMMSTLSVMVSQLVSGFEQFQSSFEHTKSSLSDISMQHIGLNKDLEETLKHQENQNLVTVKSRRLCEKLISNQSATSQPWFKVPNHISVLMSKELNEKVKLVKAEVEHVHNEAQMLKNIDLSQVQNFVESVLESHKIRIMALSDKLTTLLNVLDYRKYTSISTEGKTIHVNGIEKPDEKEKDKYVVDHPLGENVNLWSGVSGEPSVLRRKFMDGVGIQLKRKHPEESQVNQVKLQIHHLRRFNSSYDDPDSPYQSVYGLSIKEILAPMMQNQQMFMQGSGTAGLFGNAASGSGGLFGATNTGTTNLFGNASNTTGTTNLFGSTPATTASSNLFAGRTPSTMGTSNLFGSTNTTGTAATNLYGNTQSGVSNLFGASGTGFGTTALTNPAQTTTGNIFGATATPAFGTTSGSTSTGSNLFGNTTSTGFGSTSSNTAATNLFGNTASTTGTSNLFGNVAANTGSGSTNLFGNTSGTTRTNLFGTGTGFGSNTTNAGSSVFGNTSNTNTGTSLFGQGSTSSSSSNLFGTNTQQRSTGTELAIYQPTTTFSSFGRR